MRDDSKKPESIDSPTGGDDVSRREFIDRAATLGVSTAVLASMIAAGTVPGEAKAATPKKGGHLRLGMASGNTSDSLDPEIAGTEFINITRSGLRNSLVEVDNKGILQPELAESWEPGDSPATWIYNLRKDVTFHDGKTFDAEDVIASIWIHGTEKSKSAYKTNTKFIETMEADGKHRVIIRLKEPNAYFPFLSAVFEMLPAKNGELY
ncbi:MAG: ABC transporter substrate-binding protein, partial [Pirellulaceae bacterium]|nr:ABC transporter substrate-binding protein [Pirellulaceae bacterium]